MGRLGPSRADGIKRPLSMKFKGIQISRKSAIVMLDGRKSSHHDRRGRVRLGGMNTFLEPFPGLFSPKVDKSIGTSLLKYPPKRLGVVNLKNKKVRFVFKKKDSFIALMDEVELHWCVQCHQRPTPHPQP